MNNSIKAESPAITPGAAQAITYHNHEADSVHLRAVEALKLYNAAMSRLQKALAVGDGDAATIAEAQADAAWSQMNALLQQGYQHRNSAAIAAGMAAFSAENHAPRRNCRNFRPLSRRGRNRANVVLRQPGASLRNYGRIRCCAALEPVAG